MQKISAFLRRKDIVFSPKRYFIDAMSAMAQGLFCSLLIGTIIKTLGQQLGMEFLIEVGGYASAMSGTSSSLWARATAQWPTPSAACARLWWARVWPWPSDKP